MGNSQDGGLWSKSGPPPPSGSGVIKVFLFGVRCVSKSTLFKQITAHYSKRWRSLGPNGVPASEHEDYFGVLQRNLFRLMTFINERVLRLPPDPNIGTALEYYGQIFESAERNEAHNRVLEYCRALCEKWRSDETVRLFLRSVVFDTGNEREWTTPHPQYLLANADRLIAGPFSTVTVKDVFVSYYRTKGLVQNELKISNSRDESVEPVSVSVIDCCDVSNGGGWKLLAAEPSSIGLFVVPLDSLLEPVEHPTGGEKRFQSLLSRCLEYWSEVANHKGGKWSRPVLVLSRLDLFDQQWMSSHPSDGFALPTTGSIAPAQDAKLAPPPVVAAATAVAAGTAADTKQAATAAPTAAPTASSGRVLSYIDRWRRDYPQSDSPFAGYTGPATDRTSVLQYIIGLFRALCTAKGSTPMRCAVLSAFDAPAVCTVLETSLFSFMSAASAGSGTASPVRSNSPPPHAATGSSSPLASASDSGTVPPALMSLPRAVCSFESFIALPKPFPVDTTSVPGVSLLRFGHTRAAPVLWSPALHHSHCSLHFRRIIRLLLRIWTIGKRRITIDRSSVRIPFARIPKDVLYRVFVFLPEPLWDQLYTTPVS